MCMGEREKKRKKMLSISGGATVLKGRKFLAEAVEVCSFIQGNLVLKGEVFLLFLRASGWFSRNFCSEGSHGRPKEKKNPGSERNELPRRGNKRNLL